MNKRVTIGVALVLVVLVGFVLIQSFRRQQTSAATEYETVVARKETILATVNASGNIVPNRQVTMNLASGGVLTDLTVKAGQEVAAGDRLASLDTRQLQASVTQAEATLKINEARLAQTRAGTSAADLAASEAAVESAQALYQSAKSKLGLRSDQLTIAEADLKKAELALQDAQAAYDRVAYRPDIGMLPQAGALERATVDYQRAQSNYKLQVVAVDDTSFKSAASQLAQAKAQLDKLRRAPTPEDLTIAEAQVTQAEASLEQAKLRLDDAVLTAPFAGIVLSADAQVSELVSAATPIVVLAELEPYRVEATIDETDIGRLQEGQDAVINLDAFPDQKLQGKVTHVDLLGKAVQGVVSYAIQVEILPTDVAVRPGMTAIVDIVVTRKEDVVVVPNRAVKRDNRGKYYVEVMRAGKVGQQYVTIGLSNETVTEIVDGVGEGDDVVVTAPRKTLLSNVGSGSMFGLQSGGQSQ